MPEIITSGKLYRAVPPLFGIKSKGGGNTKYFATKVDFAKHIQNLFNAKYSFTTLDSKKFSNNEASAFFIRNMDYSHDLDVMANIFAINPYLLELILFYIANNITIQPVTTAAFARRMDILRSMDTRQLITTAGFAKKIQEVADSAPNGETEMDETLVPVMTKSVYSTLPYYLNRTYSIKQLGSMLKKIYKYLEITEINGCALIQGLVDSKYQYLVINDHFIRTCMNLILLIKKNTGMYYILNGEKVTLYTLMKTFEKMTPSGLTRYKGLGEQDPAQLGESVLRPDSDRTLVRYTLESVKEEIESLRYIDSTMASLINQAKITKQDIE